MNVRAAVPLILLFGLKWVSPSFALNETVCANDIALAQLIPPGYTPDHFDRAVIIADPVSSGALLPPAFLRAGILPIYVKSDLSLVERQERTLNLSHFAYRSTLPQALLEKLESGNLASTLEALREVRKILSIPIVAGVSGGESGVMFSERIAAAMQLPLRNDPRGIKSHRSKWHQHEEARKKGIKIIPQILTHSPQQAVNWVNRTMGGWRSLGRVVVKSGLSHAGDQVVICENDEQLAAAVEQLLKVQTSFKRTNRSVIVQKFIPGREFAVNGALYRSEGKLFIRFTDVWEYIKPAPPKYGHEVLLGHREVPPQLFSSQAGLVDALLFDFGLFHGEWKMDETGQVWLMENAHRLYGAGNADISANSTDYGQVQALVDIVRSPDQFIRQAQTPYNLSHRPIVVNINVPDSSTQLFASLERLTAFHQKLQRNNHLFKMIYFVEEGAPLNATTDLISTLAQIEIRVPLRDSKSEQIIRAYLDEIQQLQDSGVLWRQESPKEVSSNNET